MSAQTNGHLRLVPRPPDEAHSGVPDDEEARIGSDRAVEEGRTEGAGSSEAPEAEDADTRYLRLLFQNAIAHLGEDGEAATCVALGWAVISDHSPVSVVVQGVDSLYRFVRRSVRSTDVVGRLFHDAVCVVLPGQTSTGGLAVARRLTTRWREMIARREPVVRHPGVVAAVVSIRDAPAGGEHLLRTLQVTLETARRRGAYVVCRFEPDERSPVELPQLTNGDIAAMYPHLARLLAYREVRNALHFLGTREVHPHLDYAGTLRVADRSLAIAQVLRIHRDDQAHIACAALLRDIGMLSLPVPILLRNGPLNPNDVKLVRLHPRSSVRRTESILTEEARHAIMHHHERMDGRGYPAGLKGFAIPRAARIISVADAFEAMRSARPYRPPFSTEAALDELGRGVGKQFDGEMVNAFLKSDAIATPKQT